METQFINKWHFIRSWAAIYSFYSLQFPKGPFHLYGIKKIIKNKLVWEESKSRLILIAVWHTVYIFTYIYLYIFIYIILHGRREFGKEHVERIYNFIFISVKHSTLLIRYILFVSLVLSKDWLWQGNRCQKAITLITTRLLPPI